MARSQSCRGKVNRTPPKTRVLTKHLKLYHGSVMKFLHTNRDGKRAATPKQPCRKYTPYTV